MAISKQWIHHVEAWQRSGLTQAAFCQQHNLNRKTFSARLSDYRKGRSASPARLIPVEVQTLGRVADPLVIECAKGFRLVLPATTSATWLGELLRCLD